VSFSNASALHKEDNVIDVFAPTMAFESQRALSGYNNFPPNFVVEEACSSLQVQPIQHIDEPKHNDR